MRYVLLLIAGGLLLPAQTVWLRYGGLHTRKVITNITPGNPPTITVPNHGFTPGARIWCHDVWGVPNINGLRRVVNVSGDTFQITEFSGVYVNAPGSWYGGGSCGTVQPVTLAPNPRIMLDGPTGSLTTSVTDPDGTGPQLAPKLASNPNWNGWTRMVSRAAGCTTASCAAQSADKTAGYAPLYHAMLWLADKSRTQSRDDALYWLRNFEKTFSQSSAHPFPTGCAKSLTTCGMSGEWLDSRSWIHHYNLYTYDIMRGELTPQERQDFAAKIVKGVMGEPCTNSLAEAEGTLTFNAGSTIVSGTDTNFDASYVGKRISLRAASASWQWRYVASVESATSLTLTAAATITGSNVPWHREQTWNASHCGLLWTAGHHPYTPGWYVRKRYTKTAAAVTSTQGTVTVDNAGALGKPTPYDIRIGSEVMEVTDVSGNTLTVRRARIGTVSPASHAAGAAVYSADTFYLDGGATTGTFLSTLSYLGVMENYTHNLTWAHTWGAIMAGLTLASDSETARQLFEEGWNVFYDYHMPWYKDMFTLAQNGGTASYITRYTTFIGMLAAAMRHATAGVIDITDGGWLIDQAYNFGPLMKPWDKTRHFHYTDSASILDRWDPKQYDGVLVLGYLYPHDDRAGWARWHLYQETTPSRYSQLDEVVFHLLWLWEPNDIACPSSINGKKCIDYRNDAPPHVFTVKTDHDPAAPCPTSSKPLSCYSNPDNGYNAGLSFSSWDADGSAVWYFGFGLTKDHMPGYSTPMEYQIARNAMLLAGGGSSGCGPCASTFEQDQTAVGVATDVRRGFSNPEDSTSGTNALGTRGIVSRVDRVKGNATYSYWRVNGRYAYRSVVGIDRAFRNFLHLKAGVQDYIVVMDDYNTTSAQRLGINLPYHRMDVSKTMTDAWSRTEGNVAFSPLPNARLNTSIPLRPVSTFSETDYTFQNAGGTGLVRRLIANETTAASGPRQWIVVHQAANSNATEMPPLSLLETISANSVGVLISDTEPRVAIFDNNGSATNTTVTFTLSGLSADAHIVATGLQPGTYEVSKNGVAILSAVTAGSDGTLEITGHGNGSFAIILTGATLPVDITTTSVPAGIQHIAYSQTLLASGGIAPYNWSVVSGTMCSGLALSGTGVISGTPTVAQTCNFTARATDLGTGSDTQLLSITIAPGVPSLTLVPSDDLITGTLAQSFSTTLAAGGGTPPYTFAIQSGVLPDGLELNEATGVIQGVASIIGDYPVIARVTDSMNASATVATAIRIQPNTGLTVRRSVAAGGTVYVQFAGAPDANQPCKVVIRDADGDLLEETIAQPGASVRSVVLSGLPAGSPVAPQVSCATVGVQGVNVANPSTTAGAATVALRFSAPAGRGIANMLVEYGETEALGASAVEACSASCAVLLTVPRGALYYRWTWRDAANAIVAGPSQVRAEIVR